MRPASAGAAGVVDVDAAIGAGEDFDPRDLPADAEGFAALHRLARDGDAEGVRALLARGVDVRLVTSAPVEPPIPWMPGVDAELEAYERPAAALGFDVAARLRALRHVNWEPAHFAAEAGRGDVLRILLDAGASVRQKAGTERASICTPLHFAVASGSAECLRVLVERGGRKKKDSLQRALAVASGRVRPEIVRTAFELSQRAGEKQLSVGGLVEVFAGSGNADALRAALELEQPEPGDLSRAVGTHDALCAAARAGRGEVVRALVLEFGAPIEPPAAPAARGAYSYSSEPRFPPLLCCAAVGGCADVVRFLAGRGAALEARDRGGRTPAVVAADSGRLEALEALIEAGCDVHAERPAGAADAARTLLELGSDPAFGSAPGTVGVGPLHFAVQNGDAALVRELMERGTVLWPRRRGPVPSPYEIAAALDRRDLLELLLDRAPLDAGGLGACLAEAAAAGAAACAAFLLERGAPVDARVDVGGALATPLLLAAAAGRYETKRTPTAASRGRGGGGGDEVDPLPQLVSVAGFSALERAAQGGYARVVRLLSRHGAQVERPRAPGERRSSALGLAMTGARDGAALDALLDLGANAGNPRAIFDAASQFGGAAEFSSCLHAAAARRDLRSLRRLLEAGAGPDARDGDGNTPVLAALAAWDRRARLNIS
eukprot:tig00000190_g13845.t1